MNQATPADIERLERFLDRAAEAIYAEYRKLADAGKLTVDAAEEYGKTVQAFAELYPRCIEAAEASHGGPWPELRALFESQQERMRKRLRFLRGLH